MSKTTIFLLGGLGGVLPILVSMVTVDLSPIIDHANALTWGNYIGYGIRVVGLVVLGGTVAMLNDGVTQPLTLVQLGIAAPALITSYVNGNLPNPAGGSHADLQLVSPAYADEFRGDVRLAGGFFSDIVNGASIRLDHLNNINRATGKASENTADFVSTYPSTVAPGPGLGTFCVTPQGQFGPGDPRPLGSACSVNTSSGTFSGQVAHAPAPPSGMGNYCATATARFGPGPVNPLGAPCRVSAPTGPVVGKVTTEEG